MDNKDKKIIELEKMLEARKTQLVGYQDIEKELERVKFNHMTVLQDVYDMINRGEKERCLKSLWKKIWANKLNRGAK